MGLFDFGKQIIKTAVDVAVLPLSVVEDVVTGDSGATVDNVEELAEWIRAQLKILGFDLQPTGMSWGVLK